MADFAFRKYMAALKVDISKLKIVDQAPPDGAKSLVDGSVDIECIFGDASSKAVGVVSKPIMTKAQKVEAGIDSFDVISVTESFATEGPELVKSFLEVTSEANAAWKGTDALIAKVAKDTGMNVETTKKQMADFIFPTAKEQLEKCFSKGGIAASAAASLGLVFKGDSDCKKIAKTIVGPLLK